MRRVGFDINQRYRALVEVTRTVRFNDEVRCSAWSGKEGFTEEEIVEGRSGRVLETFDEDARWLVFGSFPTAGASPRKS